MMCCNVLKVLQCVLRFCVVVRCVVVSSGGALFSHPVREFLSPSQ